jgi:hypothetical protein
LLGPTGQRLGREFCRNGMRLRLRDNCNAETIARLTQVCRTHLDSPMAQFFWKRFKRIIDACFLQWIRSWVRFPSPCLVE